LIPLYDENPTKTFPFITLLLIIANVLIFVWEISLGPTGLNKAILQYGFVPKNLSLALEQGQFVSPAVLSVFTSIFLHGGFIHIFGNMLYLWIFGNNVEDLFGHFKFVIFYLLAGIAGVAGQTLAGPTSAIPGIGASGAIAGVLASYLIKYPRAKVVTAVPIFFFIQLVKLPAIVVLGFWIIIQFTSGLASLADAGHNFGGGVAWFAHIGGFSMGILLTIILPKRRYSGR
jgi:membrane associated rhomboid family serine protease